MCCPAICRQGIIVNMIKALQKKEKRLQAHVETWTTKLRKHQNARLTTALLFFASLVPISMMETATAIFAIPALLILVFAVLVIRTKKIQRHTTHLERLLHKQRSLSVKYLLF